MRGNYTEEQKAEVMEMLQAKVKATEIEEITGVKVGTIYRWRSEAKKIFEENNTSKVEDEGSSKQKTFEDQASKIEAFEAEILELRRFQKATIAAFSYILEDVIKTLENKDTEDMQAMSKKIFQDNLNRKRMLRDAFCSSD